MLSRIFFSMVSKMVKTEMMFSPAVPVLIAFMGMLATTRHLVATGMTLFMVSTEMTFFQAMLEMIACMVVLVSTRYLVVTGMI